MAEGAEQKTTDEDEGGAKPERQAAPAPLPPRRFNVKVVSGIGLLAVAMAGMAALAYYYVEQERIRDLQAWQVRLGIVADSRAAAVNEWAEINFGHMRELAQNASLQLYMTELAAAKGDAAQVTDEAAQAQYLRNLLVATAERTGFKPPAPVAEIAANVEVAGVAGIGLVDATGKPIVSTPAMPPLTAKIRAQIGKALDGEPAFIDAFLGADNKPAVGFVLPIYGIQDNPQGARGIGAVVGVRPLGDDLFQRLKQPGDTAQTAETYLIRRSGGTVEFLSPLKDGTPPLKRTLSVDTPDLAEAYALEKPGGFAVKRDYAAEDVLVASRSLGSLPWILARKISRREALAETDARLTVLLGVFVSLIVITSLTILFVWKKGASARATQALHEAQVAVERFSNMSKFMRVVTNSQPTQIAAVDGNTVYTFANEPAAKAAGVAPQDLIGKTMASVIGPIKAQALADVNKEVLKEFKRISHVHVFGDEGDEDFQVIRSDHIPLRADRDYPPGVLMVLDDMTELARERRRSENMLRQLINTLVSVVDRRDPYSANHSARVADVARAIAAEMGLEDVEVKTAEIAGSLMNLGKIFIPPELLTKAADLTAEERALVANSYLVTVDLLEGVPFEGPVVETIRQLGETWDGRGPLGLKEEEILRTARILTVANTFVGMVSPRAYRGAMTLEKACDILLQQSGTKFDRKPVSALVNYIENRGGTEAWAHFRDNPLEAPAAAEAEAEPEHRPVALGRRPELVDR
jgi:HD-GYP domain-containing protein (c-di-GMP phosphodiesterase class II)